LIARCIQAKGIGGAEESLQGPVAAIALQPKGQPSPARRSWRLTPGSQRLGIAADLATAQLLEQGHEVVIARSGVPIARLVAWQAPARPLAAPGAMRGQIQLSDDFDAPLDRLFEALQ
jgi:antitoxin (DNA-binding transcriptional repressor) of toxin-antitoxin stability system